MKSLSQAISTSTQLLQPSLPGRLKHVIASGERTQVLTHLSPGRRELVCISATLHDVGYSPEIADARFHPLDGARFLRSQGWGEDITNLVAHHSYSRIEANQFGLLDDLESEFPFNAELPHDELCFCDMSTGPSGEFLTIDERLADIRARHKDNRPKLIALDAAENKLRESYQRVQHQLGCSQQALLHQEGS